MMIHIQIMWEMKVTNIKKKYGKEDLNKYDDS